LLVNENFIFENSKNYRSKLKHAVLAWWDRLLEARRQKGKRPVETWEQMKQLLRDRFLPLDYDQFLFHKYQRCSQGSQNANEYTTEFLHLAKQNNLHETDGQQVARYVEGLKPIIRNRIELWMLNVTDA
jgi:hypothetical protein